MKTKLLFSILICLAMAYNSAAQQLCTNPPTCIQNGDLVGPTTSGDMNSTPALTVPNWFVSHGTPSYGPSQVWMWSYGGWGEGMFTCYNFIAGHQYQVCLRANYAGTNTNGNLLLDATTGLPQSFTTFGPMPVPTTNQSIGITNVTNPAWSVYTYVFTANANYSQLWIRPFESTNDHSTQYAVTVDNIHVEDLSLPSPVLSITPSGPFVNGSPVNLTASGGPAGTTYNWSPSGTVGNPISVTPNCDDQIISVVGTFNNCPTPGIQICARATAPATIDVRATQGCCGIITSTTYCNGLNGMMDFWITNTSSFNFNAYRLHILPSGSVVDWSNSISIPVGSTGGPYTINLTSLGLPPGSTVCFYLELIQYGQELCPKNVCKTDQFCITVPKECTVQDCCNAWGTIVYDDYTDPNAPVSRITNCGAKLPIPCGTVNAFDFNYTCKEGCLPSFKSELYNSSGTLVYTNASTGSSSWYHISGLPLTSTDLYTLRVYAYCGDKLCETCELYLDVNCNNIQGRTSATPMLHSIIPNPASSMATVVSRGEPILSYALQTRDGVTLLSSTGINKNEVTIDIRSIPNGMYTLIINNHYTYKLIKQE